MKKITFTAAIEGNGVQQNGTVIADGSVDFSRNSIPLTHNFDSSKPPIVFVDHIYRDGHDIKVSAVIPDDTLLDLIPAIGIKFDDKDTHLEGEIRVIDRCDLYEVSLCKDNIDPSIKSLREQINNPIHRIPGIDMSQVIPSKPDFVKENKSKPSPYKP